MRRRDTHDVAASALAVLADAAAIGGGFLLATWLRFDSGLIPLRHDAAPAHLYVLYGSGAAVATLLFLFLFRALGLYVRPQIGSFPNRIPRLIRGVGLGLLLTTALAFVVRTEPPFSRLTVALSFGTITLLVLLERALLFAAEIRFARRSPSPNRVLIVGTDDVAAHLKRAIEGEPRLRSRVLGFVGTATAAPDPDIPLALVLGPLSSLDHIVGSQRVDQIILTDSTLDYRRLVELVLLCERNLITFNVVPDLFRLMTTRVDVRTVDGIPLLGVSAMPLDGFWNRFWKRAEDLAGASVGLVLAAPVIAFAALLIKRTSPGPVFYRQERCGEDGHRFTLYKLRTMREDAERDTGPVWTTENDPRRTPAGAWLRRLGLDELPQLWNVLRGDMSLVGPRPERPHFVEQFREDISRYMWRHVSRPGITGWAQVNGLRGNTGIEERIKYDLYYLENWSLALDVKILLRTLFSRRNAY